MGRVCVGRSGGGRVGSGGVRRSDDACRCRVGGGGGCVGRVCVGRRGPVAVMVVVMVLVFRWS